ncbi:polyprenol phosphomannose-dependent alpha 1,6 mannosyltransferase MptB [Pseudonocardia bannensis]|uniref:Polyprenol phosphomannose-dependent alpha 1,6 mannosyltransferase MptB n=1 Tax=Pseudonocardia bannensis TaxID=630973 RepID=A0A848DNK1_9PSEU|nr:polyprenol phosphomannose-dependent alpha 1,6 mannosyltransferase MptB [Pseudonocardia bannensis]NMH94125.1 polyprenol phosphomannose-dependent alpha 1,6 mannosyltransferase MptB [Pseudonocardia bannensis]
MAAPGLDPSRFGPGLDPRTPARSPAGPFLPSSPPPDPSRLARRLGLTGALLMAIGALGGGALPVPNPLNGLRVLGLPARNATVSIAVVYAGMGMLVLAWLWIGRMLRARGAVAPAPDHGQLARTGLLWALPLAAAPPMFSKDVYSYLAQSAITARGLDPYALGPAQALGVDDPLTRTIPTIWRDTPAPYGPLFLALGRGITALTGDDVILGVIAHRALAVAGVALIIWALPRLAERCGLEPGLALWLGAANPLVLFHLVSGIHNEALMIGLMLAGLEIGLRSQRRGWVWGAVLITAGAAVKLPAILALGFLGMHLARRWGGRVRDVALAAAALTAIAVAVFAAFGFGTGLGFGWLGTLGTANVIRSWMSLSTDLGQLSGQIGILAGLGDHTDSVLTLTRGLGGLAAALLCGLLLLATLRGRVEPVTGLGAGLGAVVLLGPVVHPWYLLWAAIPLAATRGLPRYRRVALAASAVLALMVPPTGADFAFRAYQLPMSIVAGVVVLGAAVLMVRRRLRAEADAVLPASDTGPAPG